jgi:hypothetical protein
MIGGAWDGDWRVWVFEADDSDRVRTLCQEVYGTDGTEPFPNPAGYGSNSHHFAEPMPATARGYESG